MEVIEKIREISSIVEIASQYTTLRKRGRTFVGLCPFHSEKGPSFHVDDEKQLYHCFGCGAGGDVFSLVMEKERLTFPEALRYLAEKYRIPLPATRAESAAAQQEDAHLRVNDQALAFFQKSLAGGEEGAAAREYLKKRGLADDLVRTMKIGYAPNAWDGLLKYGRKNNIPAALLEKAGLALQGRKAGEHYDRFRGRIIFPIFSLSGKVVAFGGRTLFDADPKYLNSPETPVYTKGRHLYGLHLSKDAVRKAGELILVEGYTDLIALIQAGFENAAASLGTSLTSYQAAQAARFAPRIVLAYDGDEAGRTAALRAVPICFERGLHVRVCLFPEKLDPDAFLRKYGRDRFSALLEKAVPGIRFLVDHHAGNARMDVPEEKAKAVRAVIRDLERIPDALVQSEYFRQAGELLGVGESVLRSLAEHRSGRAAADPGDRLSPAEQRLFRILMEDRTAAPEVFAEVRDDDFKGLPSEPVFAFIQDCFRENRPWSLSEMKDRIRPDLFNLLSRALMEKNACATIEEARECLHCLRKVRLQTRLAEIQKDIIQSERKGEKERVASLMYLKQDVTKQILSL